MKKCFEYWQYDTAKQKFTAGVVQANNLANAKNILGTHYRSDYTDNFNHENWHVKEIDFTKNKCVEICHR